MQIQQNCDVKFKFDTFVLKNPTDYSKQQPVKKKRKRTGSKVAFGSSLERLKNTALPTLPDYDINYHLVEPNTRKAVIPKQEKTKRSLTEISKSIHTPSNNKLPQLQQHIPVFQNLKPCLFQIKEYTPKMYQLLPLNSYELKECFNNLLSKHKVKKPDIDYIY